MQTGLHVSIYITASQNLDKLFQVVLIILLGLYITWFTVQSTESTQIPSDNLSTICQLVFKFTCPVNKSCESWLVLASCCWSNTKTDSVLWHRLCLLPLRVTEQILLSAVRRMSAPVSYNSKGGGQTLCDSCHICYPCQSRREADPLFAVSPEECVKWASSLPGTLNPVSVLLNSSYQSGLVFLSVWKHLLPLCLVLFTETSMGLEPFFLGFFSPKAWRWILCLEMLLVCLVSFPPPLTVLLCKWTTLEHSD